MSTTLYEARGLQLSRHVGPADEGPDRRRWQITTDPYGFNVLNRAELRAFAAAVRLADEQAGPVEGDTRALDIPVANTWILERYENGRWERQ